MVFASECMYSTPVLAKYWICWQTGEGILDKHT